LQRAFYDRIKEQGLDRSYFANEDQLARVVLKQDWPKKRTGKPIALPYPSLGDLFRGREEFSKELHASLSRGRCRSASLAARFMVSAVSAKLGLRSNVPGRTRTTLQRCCS
jgi:hypothetical protein